VVVTIGTGRHFSTGFDIPAWVKDPLLYYPSMDLFSILLERLLTLSLPTMCVFNGSAMAGGFFMGACHEHRIMNANKGWI